MSVSRFIFTGLNLIIFLLIQHFYSLWYAAIISFIITSFQALILFFKEKRLDKTIFAELFFLIIISLFIHFELDEVIQDLIFECVLLIVLLLIYYLPQKILLKIFSLKLENNDPQLIQNIYRLLQILIFLFTLHLLIIVSLIVLTYDFNFMIKWPAYLILIMIFMLWNHFYYPIQFTYWRVRYPNDEYIPFIDTNGRIMFNVPRLVAHKKPLYRHPTVHLLIINSNQELLLQKRSASKRLYPLRWDSSVGGHISQGESVESALQKEALEEIGIENFKARLIGKYSIVAENNIELVMLFITEAEGPFRPNPHELDELRFWTFDEIDSADSLLFTKHLIENEIPVLKNYLIGNASKKKRN